jgi:hypothetical protein
MVMNPTAAGGIRTTRKIGFATKPRKRTPNIRQRTLAAVKEDRINQGLQKPVEKKNQIRRRL